MLIAFICIAALMVLVGLALVVWPLVTTRGDDGEAERRAMNLAILRQQYDELKAAHEAGTIADDEYEETRSEIETRVLDETRESPGILRTGGRTFEAAAFLRRLGADTQDVQRLFQGDLQSMIDRYAIIRQAELYHDDIAVVALEEECDRVTAAKAADELLTIRGIKASFVLYKKGDGVYMSARSLGEINVQVILEPLGGGGNTATAGAQMKDTTVKEALDELVASIDKFYEE